MNLIPLQYTPASVSLALEEIQAQHPAWAETQRARLERALQILNRPGSIQRDTEPPHDFVVESASAPDLCYTVSSEPAACTCPDFEKRAKREGHVVECKHRIAVYLAVRAAEITEQVRQQQRAEIELDGERERARQFEALLDHIMTAIADTDSALALPAGELRQLIARDLAPYAHIAQDRRSCYPAPAPTQLFPEDTPARWCVCTICMDTGDVELANGQVKRCWCQAEPDDPHDREGVSYFEVAGEPGSEHDDKPIPFESEIPDRGDWTERIVEVSESKAGGATEQPPASVVVDQTPLGGTP